MNNACTVWKQINIPNMVRPTLQLRPNAEGCSSRGAAGHPIQLYCLHRQPHPPPRCTRPRLQCYAVPACMAAGRHSPSTMHRMPLVGGKDTLPAIPKSALHKTKIAAIGMCRAMQGDGYRCAVVEKVEAALQKGGVPPQAASAVNRKERLSAAEEGEAEDLL